MNRAILLSMVVLLVLTGCSSKVAVTKVDPKDPKTHVGIPHPLLYSRYDVTMNWQVKKCGKKLELLVKSEFSDPISAVDGNQLYVIDPNSLSGIFKTSKLSVGYSEMGAPMSLNAEIKDHTAEVLLNVASVGLGVAKLAAVPIPGAPAAPAPGDVCTDEVVKALLDLVTQNETVFASTVVLESRTEELKAITEKITSLGDNVDEQTKVALSEAVTKLSEAKTKLNTATKTHSKTLKGITHSKTIRWPSDSSKFDGTHELPDYVLKRWTRAGVDYPDVRSKATIHLSLKLVDSSGQVSKGSIDPKLGIPIRRGGDGIVSSCFGTDCKNKWEMKSSRKDHIQQLGQVYYLPCTSRLFSSVSCSYTRHDNGRLKSIGSVRENASAETFTGALDDIIGKATEARIALAEADRKQLEADTAYLKAKAERESAEIAIAETVNPGDAQGTAALKAYSERLNAERAVLEADLALKKAQLAAANK